MDSIQTAYAGFAKQNYTMLDNLKLGYGGTKEEMQRLLEDAEKISGVHYDISNLSDVYSAIHVIQTELDITGTTAKEASQTLAGSAAALGSAWKNVLGKITIGDDISDELGELRDSLLTFADNLLPAVGNMIDNLPAVFDGAIGIVGDLIPKIGEAVGQHADALMEAGHTLLQGIISGIIEYGPGMVDGAIALIGELRNAIVENLPGLLEAGGTILTNIISGITESLPMMLNAGSTVLSTIVSGITQNIGTLWDTGANIIGNIKDTITNNLPNLLQSGTEILANLQRGIIDHIPDIITAAGSAVNGFIDFVYDNAPELLQSGADLLMNLVTGIVDNLPEIAGAAIHTIADFAKTIGEHLPEMAQKGIEIIGQLVAGLIKAIPDIIAAIPQILKTIADEFLGFDWIGLGADIITGIGKGIVDFAGNIKDAVAEAGSKALAGIKDFFGIASPSKLMANEVGKYIPAGIAVGIEANTAPLERSMSRMDRMILSDVGSITGNTSAAGYRNTNNTNTYNYGGFNLSVYGAEGQDEEVLADIIEARIRARMEQEEAVFA
jgi:phage-related protein